jgi:enoyl-CoA hydratase/carnithine racemase
MSMTEQVLVTHDCAVRIVRLNRSEQKNALTQAFSLLATARPPSAEAAKAAGLVSDGVDAAQVDEAVQAARESAVPPAGAVALSRRLRGDSDDVVKRIDVETMHFKKRPQWDETSSVVAAFPLRKI